MNRISTLALLFIAACTLQAPAQAQTAYRCGNSYSQTPCPSGKAVDISDGRNDAQKAQTDTATQRDQRTGNSMEQARLKQEENQRRSLNAAAQAQDKKTVKKEKKPTHPQRYAKNKRQKNSAYFTVKAPSEKKQKKSAAGSAN